jgi:tRNA acetyltransferase TAN1
MVLKNFNLIISTRRRFENDASSEIWFLLGKMDSELLIEKTDISGLVLVKTFLDPFKVIEYLRCMIKKKPDEFRYILKVTPIEEVVRSNIQDIKEAGIKISSKISNEEKFRITVRKRHTTLSSKEIINVVADSIDRIVDLDKPDKIIHIEVLGGITGICLIKPNDILSISKHKLCESS